MSASERFDLVEGADAREVPTRLLVVQEDERPAVHQVDEEMVMTFPHLLVKELIAFLVLSIFLVGLSLLVNAPLEELANPEKTPNPSKAPWYFLGLQELLHYYSPLVSGVVLPTLVIVGLVVVPYFHINLKREPLWQTRHGLKLATVAGIIAALCVLFYVSGQHPVWSLIGTTLFIGALMLAPAVFGTGNRALAWLGTRSVAFWIFSWFLIAAVVLTVIGTLFRGPGWAFTLPWRDGIY